jgi:hydroxyacylglutathione hydrolase
MHRTSFDVVPRLSSFVKNPAAASGIRRIIARACEALSPSQISKLQREGYVVLDVRPAAAFGNGHVPGAPNIALAGQFASWAGTLIPQGSPILLVAEDEAGVDESVQRLARVGIETVKGFLDGLGHGWRSCRHRGSNAHRRTPSSTHR